MSSNQFFLIANLLLVAIACALQPSHLVEGSRTAQGKDYEQEQRQQQLDQLQSSTNQILELEALKDQQPQFRRQQQQQQQAGELIRNSQEVAALLGRAAGAVVGGGVSSAATASANNNNIQPLVRLQRSIGPYTGGNNQATSGLAQQLLSQQQMLEADEHALRRQLPDLIVQARNDKAIERILLRMLINSSLRSTPQANGGPFAGGYNDRNSIWQQDNYSGADGIYDTGAARPASARLELGQLDSDPLQTGDLSIYPSSSIMDKREYIKPCSFNAVSCAKNPFRKL